MMLYKFLNADGSAANGGKGKWHLPKGKRPGKWMPPVEKVIPCECGYHLCRPQDLLQWLGPVLYEAEGRGESIVHDTKVVFQEARLIRLIPEWNERTARLFACDCAEDVLPLFEREWPRDGRPRRCIEVARLYAEGKATDDELAAARAAARDAAWDAARAAARDKYTKNLLRYLAGEVGRGE